MEINRHFSFQADSDIVNALYINHANYIIEYNPDVDNKICILYFSSNDLYYPNNELAFKEQLLNKNRFEWYKTRITGASKHIFLRDIKKQWYLTGINAQVDTPDKLLSFLIEETKGFKVMAVGSSSGGFAAVIYGQLLKAERIYSFNGQFEILSLLNQSTENINPIVFRYSRDEHLKLWYDTKNFIKEPSTIYYFHSSRNNWDKEQNQHIKDLKLKTISFITSNHGIPFLKTNLPAVLNMPIDDLNVLTGTTIHPIIFSLRIVGLYKTLEGINSIIIFVLKKIYIKTILKLKQGYKTSANMSCLVL